MGHKKRLYFFLCPKCSALLMSYGMIYQEWFYVVRDTETDNVLESRSSGKDPRYAVYCPLCDYQSTSKIDPRYFMVEITESGIRPLKDAAGKSYWEDNKLPKKVKMQLKDLERIAKKVMRERFLDVFGGKKYYKEYSMITDMLLRVGIPVEIVQEKTKGYEILFLVIPVDYLTKLFEVFS